MFHAEEKVMKTFYRRSSNKTKGCMMVMVTLNMIEKLDRFNNQNNNIVADAVKNIGLYC